MPRIRRKLIAEMDEAVEDVTFIPPSLTLSSRQMEVFQELRKAGDLIDFKVISQGQKFPCHRVVLAASSSVFRAMLTTRMIEATTHQASFNTIPPAVLEFLIEHMYQQPVTIPNELLVQTIEACHFLDLIELKLKCSDKAVLAITPSNVFSWYMLTGGPEHSCLRSKCCNILAASLQVASRQTEFMDLAEDKIPVLLRNVETSANPDDMLEACMRWINHKPEDRVASMEALFKIVPLARCSVECLEAVTRTHTALFQKCPVVLAQVTQCALQFAMGRDYRKQRVSIPQSGERIVLYNSRGCMKHKELYELTAECMELERMCTIPEDFLGSSICSIPGGFAVTGGTTNKCLIFLLQSKTWITLTPVKGHRYSHGSCFMRGRIYLFGGGASSSYQATSTVVSLKLSEEGGWQDEPDMPLKIMSPEVACLNVADSRAVFVMEMKVNMELISMDPEAKRWIGRATLPDEVETVHSMVAVGDELYIAGCSPIDYCFARYNPCADHWVILTPPIHRHLNAVLINRGRSVYYMGTGDVSEKYNIERDTWYEYDPRLPKKLKYPKALRV